MKSPHFLVSVTLVLLAVSASASVESDLDRNLKTIAAAADKELPLHYANLLEKETLVRLWADKPGPGGRGHAANCWVLPQIRSSTSPNISQHDPFAYDLRS